MNHCCNDCCWYCHTDGRCYKGGKWTFLGYVEKPDMVNCRDWQFDGLENWERTELEENHA